MPPKHDISLLFHPKKKPNNGNNNGPAAPRNPTAPNNSPPKRRPPVPIPKPKDDDEEADEAFIPDQPYREYRLLSSALNGWKYDVMRFDSRKPVDVFRWQAPIKLNRKDIRKQDAASVAPPVAVGPMLGPDGKPVIGADGRIVMVDAEGRPIRPDANGGYGGGIGGGSSISGSAGGSSGSGGGMNGSKDKGKAVAAKKRFQKKTRQVFTVPEEVRQLRKEERYPWVLEDSSPSKNEYWIAQMEDVTKAETQAFFMPAANDVFKFVPAHRWYKFHKRHKHSLPTDTAEVESMYTKLNKKDPQAWLAQRTGRGISAATAALFKAEAEGTDAPGGALVYNAPQSLGPGGRKLKAVDSGSQGLFDDEDGETKARRKEDGEGDLDEQVYEEEFADDDDKMEPDPDDEEAKEIEERLKREYKAANKTIDAGIDADTDDEDLPAATKQERAMQKLIRNREGNDAYESDDDKNPYASSEEEEEEEPAVVATAMSAIQEQQQKIEARSQTPKAAPSQGLPGGTTASRPGAPPPVPPVAGSRATSPANIGHGGHSIMAKRATSPKVPKPKGANVSRGNSPLAGGSTSLPGSRATSPETNGVGGAKKRKAEDSPPATPATNGPNATLPKAKKRKAPAIEVSLEELEVMLVDWLKSTPSPTTRECIAHFNPYIGVGEEKRQAFLKVVRTHAVLRSGILVLKTPGAAPSPPATST